ncbi:MULTISPECIES: response regulator transcription factor [Gracilibacillus]|uniref:response regulator transcription factor n=1 Tax=Gracilibacillus TaxID=74385 RepID=UPI000B0BE148|nr:MULTISPECIES: response regulator transcription factor [Gracilibacillus]
MEEQTLFLVEDDERMSRVIQEELQKWGFDVAIPNNFQHIMEEFQTIQPKLVLMDISLPYFNGYHWCQEIRNLSTVPVIFLSSASDKMNMLMAMNMGADDFMAKPFDIDLLVAKIQALLRRTYDFGDKEQVLSYQDIHLSLLEGELSYQDRIVLLTPNETKILAILFNAAEKKVTKEAIMEKLWEDEAFISKNALTVNITRLRKKIAASGFPSLIHTIKGIGYMLVKEDE